MQRAKQISQLDGAQLDVLIIGGGASGAGVLLDGATRGLKIGLIERGDFMSGTSSKSTKLVHGGVRYLEQAVKTLDWSMLQLVQDALRERQRMIDMAPHLARPTPLITPITHWWQWPYLRFGLGVYDLLAGKRRIGKTRTLGRHTLSADCAALAKRYKYGIEYWDGQFDDARYGIAILRTATGYGATAANYCQSKRIRRFEHGYHVEVEDLINHNVYSLTCKAIVNCSGPWTDEVRQLIRPDSPPLLRVSGGAHIVVSQQACPIQKGVLIPSTSDGRVIFFLPWQGQVLIGTTDTDEALVASPHASDADIHYLVGEANKWLRDPITESDVKATFKGQRPLYNDKAGSTAKISRDHQIIVEDRLITLTGGKWTTWRSMAEDTVDQVFATLGFEAKDCCTADITLAGTGGCVRLDLAHLDQDVADHLWQNYGSDALKVLQSGKPNRLHRDYPWIEAEIAWAMDNEAAATPEDILSRRLRIDTIDYAVYQTLLDQLT